MNYTPATTQQILDKLRQLTEEDKLDLWRNAGSFLGGTRFSCPADLFHETVSLLLAGQRRWPIQVGFCCYMRSAMQSVAGSSRELAANALTAGQPLEETMAFKSAASEGLSPLDELIERERVSAAIDALSRAKKALKGDADAIGVVVGWLRAMSGREIRSRRKLTPQEFENAKRRAMRAVRRELPDRRN